MSVEWPLPGAPPWDHQLRGIQHFAELAWYRMYEPRLGKTRESIAEFKLQIDAKLVTRILVTAPLKPLEMTWVDELALFLPEAGVVDCFRGPIPERIRRLEALSTTPDRPQIVLVNHDALHPMRQALRLFKPDCAVGDEGHAFKNPGANRTRGWLMIAPRARFRRLLSGTPIPQSYRDLFAQYKSLDQRIFGTRVKDFEARYIARDDSPFRRIVGYHNLEELQRKLYAIATRVLRTEVFGPDQTQTIVRQVDLPDKERKLYDQIVAERVGRSDDFTITATHALQRLSVFQKLTAGYLKADDGQIAWLHDAKVDAVLSDLKEIVENGERAVVFYQFRTEGARLVKRIQADFGFDSVAQLSGDVHQIEEAMSFDPTKPDKHPRCRVLVVHPQSGGEGVSFARATYGMFASLSSNSLHHEQAKARIWAPDRPQALHYYSVRNSIDAWLRKINHDKEDAARALLDTPLREILLSEERLEGPTLLVPGSPELVPFALGSPAPPRAWWEGVF